MRVLLSGIGALVLVLGLVGLSGCAISTPNRGPGPEAGAEKVVVAVTYAQLGSDRSIFFDRSEEVMDSLEGRDGFVGGSIRRTLGGSEAWTMTAWRDEAALKTFVYDETHSRAMRDGSVALVAFRTTRFEIPASRWPLDWDEAVAEVEKKPLQRLDDIEPSSGAGG